MKSKKYIVGDAGPIRKLNAVCKPLNLQTAILEDLITLLFKSITSESQIDRDSYYNTFASHFSSYPPEVVSEVYKIANLFIRWLTTHLLNMGLLTTDCSKSLHFGGFYGLSTDIIILGD